MRVILVALDSVGIDPLGHDRPDSIYSESRFLLPKRREEVLKLTDAPVPGVLVETEVACPEHRGALECAITYTSIFSGQSALERHGLMQGLGLKESALQDMIRGENLFGRCANPCLANAVFPFHFPFLGTSFLEERLPVKDREETEKVLTMQGRPVRLLGKDKHGFAELFTLAEINQNIFVFAALEAGVQLKTWRDVRTGHALTGTMTSELESEFNWHAIGEEPLPVRTPAEAATVLANLCEHHDFIFYKYQLADLVSHTGRVDLARQTFAIIESFVEQILLSIDPRETAVIISSDHGHLEQVAYSHGHPKGNVPTWYFGPNAASVASQLRRPEGIFHVITGLCSEQQNRKPDMRARRIVTTLFPHIE